MNNSEEVSYFIRWIILILLLIGLYKNQLCKEFNLQFLGFFLFEFWKKTFF